MMYSVNSYGRMMADTIRMDAYTRALRRHITSDSVVLDIGAGTGIFSLLACKLGARKVYAVEYNDAIQVGREIAGENRYADRIEFIQADTRDISLPEQVNIIIADLRGTVPYFGGLVSVIADARERFLAPNGIIIPQTDRMWITLVDAPDIYRRQIQPWEDNDFGLSMQAVQRSLANTITKVRFKPEHLITRPQQWAMLDYRSETNPHVTADLTWTMERDCEVHGLAVWFDSQVADDIQYSNEPGKTELIYGQGFLPWSEPANLTVGDSVEVKLRGKLIGDEYVWSWRTQICSADDASQLNYEFNQSSFFSTPLSPDKLRRQQADFVPVLNEDGEIARMIITAMQDKSSHNDIAKHLMTNFPERFTDRQVATTHVGDFFNRYSK